MLTMIKLLMSTITLLYGLCSALAYGTEANLSTNIFEGKTVCEIESQLDAHGYFQPFYKDPTAISYANLVTKDNKSYVLIVDTNQKKERCEWSVIMAMEIGLAPEAVEPIKHRVSFDCAVLNKKYESSAGYFGIIPLSSKLEYVKPIKAWYFNTDSKKFLKLNTHNIYCPNSIYD